MTLDIKSAKNHMTANSLPASKMVDLTTTVGVVTAVWVVIGVVLPILVQFLMWKSPNKGIIQICLILTAVCCYLFWICTYLCQLNPLFGPQLETDLIRMMQLEWDK